MAIISVNIPNPMALRIANALAIRAGITPDTMTNQEKLDLIKAVIKAHLRKELLETEAQINSMNAYNSTISENIDDSAW